MNPMLNISASPHARGEHDTSHEMLNVIIALIPATVFGIFHFGFRTLLVVLASIVAAMVTEYLFDLVVKRPNTLWDGSAIVTGLLLALVIPSTVPLFVPVLGSVFAILVTKCFFGGLGQNFMNPALAGRAFLLISFGSLMTNYTIDGVSTATPLAALNSGGNVNVFKTFLGFAGGHIGVSAVCLLIGAAYLLWTGTITWEIPVAALGSFTILMGILGGHGFDPGYLLTEIFAGGLILGAFFMATDPVTSPMTSLGQIIFGCFIGMFSMVFRLYSNMADGTSYAIIIANLLVPLIDMVIVPKPFGLGERVDSTQPKKKFTVPGSAVVLTVITLIAGAALAGVNMMTAQKIADNQMAVNLASYQEVVPEAAEFAYDDAITAAVEEAAASGSYYGDGAYGKASINEVVVGKDASGNPVGYAVSVTTMDGFEGEITQTVGILADGTIQGISFTTIAETAGMGMLVNTDDWKAQFAGKQVDAFKLLKSGGASADEEIDSVSGASTTSGAVVNAVNAAIDFYQNHIA